MEQYTVKRRDSHIAVSSLLLIKNCCAQRKKRIYRNIYYIISKEHLEIKRIESINESADDCG